MSIEESITIDLKQRVYEELEDNWPRSVPITELSEELEEDRENTRLALRELHQRGRVSQTADWDYRAAEPPE